MTIKEGRLQDMRSYVNLIHSARWDLQVAQLHTVFAIASDMGKMIEELLAEREEILGAANP
jgi:hypothetical protein